MTENLPTNPARRVFQVNEPPPLDENYERLPTVENQIRDCLRLSENDFSERLTIRNRQSDSFVREETLVCLLYAARIKDVSRIEDSIAEKLARVCERQTRKRLRAKFYDDNFIEEAVGEIVFEMFRQITGRARKSYDFWEVHFFQTLNFLTDAYVHKHGEKHHATRLFSEMSDEDDEEADYESRLPNFEKLSPDEQIEIKEIVEKMPVENRKIFIYHSVQGWTQEEIAQAFGITARTVRNRLKQISEFLSQWREPFGGKE